MASQDGNDNKRMINITLNIELKNSESGKGYQELVKNVTKDVIDAALSPTNTINNTELKGTPNKETEKLRRSLDSNNKKRENENSNSTVTVTESVYLEAKMETSKKERKATSTVTDKGVETEAMKRVRLSLELKKMKKNKYDNTDRAKKTKASKVDTRITNEYKNKPTIETEAMKIIRLRLERKNKSKLNYKDSATANTSITNPISSIGTCQNVEGPANTKSPGKGIKRKVGDVGTDKTHDDTKGMKKMKKNNFRPNEYYPNTRTSEITNEQMDIDDENGSDHRIKQVTAATCTGFKKNTTNKTKSATEKVGVETESMRMIRRRLEIMKNKNNNKNTPTSTITGATSNTDTPTGAIKDTEQLRSPKPIKHKTLPEHTTKSPTSKTSNALTSNATLRKTDINFRHEHKGFAKYNPTPNEITDDESKENPAVNEITDDESDENPKVHKTNKVNSEIANDTKNVENEHKDASRSSSRSSYRPAMSFDEPDDNIELATGRVTRSKNWERRQWK